MNIREVITARMARLGLTRYGLAHHPDLTACSPQTIFRFLRGETALNSEALGQVLDVLGITLHTNTEGESDV